MNYRTLVRFSLAFLLNCPLVITVFILIITDQKVAKISILSKLVCELFLEQLLPLG